MNAPNHLLCLPDEILKHIIMFLGHWDKESLREVCKRLYNLVVNDVRKIVITKGWFQNVVKSHKILKKGPTKKLNSILVRERRENMVIHYITRHHNLKCLHLYQSGLSTIHRDSNWRSRMARKLAKKCPLINEILVQGTSGLSIAFEYAQEYRNYHGEDCKITTLMVDPYQSAYLFCSRLVKFMNNCPNFIKLTFISQINETDFSRDTKVIKASKSMLESFSGKLKYFSTDFSADFPFKVLALENLKELSGLTLCRSVETCNEWPFRADHVDTISQNNPQIYSLRIPLTSESIYNLKNLNNLSHLSLIVSFSITQSIFKSVFTSIGSKLTLLSFTFIPNQTGSTESERFNANFDFFLCSNLNIFSIYGNHDLHFDQLVRQIGSNCRLMEELYYSPNQVVNLSDAVESVVELCPLIRIVKINNSKYKGCDGLLYRTDNDVISTNEQFEKRFFY